MSLYLGSLPQSGYEIFNQRSAVFTKLVHWCFEPSQPLGTISGPKETFIKRYIVERTNKAEIKPKSTVRKQRVVERINGMKYS